MTSTRSGIRPDLARPRLIGELPAAKYFAAVHLELEQEHRAGAARHHLTTGRIDGTDDGPEHLARPGHRGRVAAVQIGEESGLPHPPPPGLEPAEGAGVGPGQGANEVVYAAVGIRPID